MLKSILLCSKKSDKRYKFILFPFDGGVVAHNMQYIMQILNFIICI